jgi:16S rRNA (cytosine967-C5)-methyltransferase
MRLATPVDVTTLPGFREGRVAVQDAAAQLAPRFLEAQAGMRVLDACAAPGGKACHLLELEPGLAELVALESDPARVRRLEDNLRRLGLTATVRVADAAEPDRWWDGRPFDRVLLDVPCSGTGVIRRHPDIKVLRRAADIDGFVAQQERLLAACWRVLRPGGRLVYASCSVLPAENGALIARFLARTADAVAAEDSVRLEPEGSVPMSTADLPGVVLLPGAADTDGFYYASLDKRA